MERSKPLGKRPFGVGRNINPASSSYVERNYTTRRKPNNLKPDAGTGADRFRYTLDEHEDNQRIKIMSCDGRTFLLTFKDPYGHCYVTWDSGEIPANLKCAFTDAGSAAKAIQNHLANEAHKALAVSKEQK